MVPVLDRAAASFHEESDPQLAREALPSQLKLMEGLLRSDPANRGLQALLAEAFGGYAYLFLEDSDPTRAAAAYLRGRDYAAAALRGPLAGLTSKNLDELGAALARAKAEDAPGLFWTAYGWGGWINLSKDSPDAVADLPKVAAMMERVQQLSPGFYYGGPDLFLGAYYALRPRLLGGDPAKAKAHFESAVASTQGRFLPAKVLYAQYYAVAAQDEELFKRLNQEVLDDQPDLPAARLANAVAKLKARRLMEKSNDLF